MDLASSLGQLKTGQVGKGMQPRLQLKRSTPQAGIEPATPKSVGYLTELPGQLALLKNGIT